jgi:hypothetical protein
MKRAQDSPQHIIARRIVDAFKGDSTHKRKTDDELVEVIELALEVAVNGGYVKGIEDAKAIYAKALDPKGLPS